MSRPRKPTRSRIGKPPATTLDELADRAADQRHKLVAGALNNLLLAMEAARVTGYVQPGVLRLAYEAVGRKPPG